MPETEDEPTGLNAARAAMQATGAAKPRKRSKKRAANKRPKPAAGTQDGFPRHSVEKALRIPKAILDQNAGQPTSPADAAKFTTGGKASGRFSVEVASAKKYGFLVSENGKLVPQERARRALAPQSESDRQNALQAAVLEAPVLSDVYNHYRGENLPDSEFFHNALTGTFNIPEDKISEFVKNFFESMRSAELLDESGDRVTLIDAGRDEAHRASGSGTARSVMIDEGAMCFVMQPFGGQLGTYYETIFKPAIEQAELTPVRADDDIFATGKIMDQVWRGIRQSTVLVAELTSKNPNVFYELGLAHALEKPVVLVSSNQDDVPFDLRHIRTIFYDQTDPFWGPKLIDKIADNIISALENPEEAIFRIDED